MAATYKKKYGLLWPNNPHDVFIDLVLAKKWREPYFAHGNLLAPEEHLLRAARELFTPEQFSISLWTEEHAYDWTHEKFCITWGCASSSKSNDYGCFALLDWIVDPTETYTVLASTSKGMLQVRSYESVLRYFFALKRNPYFLIPGKESKTSTFISNETSLADGGDNATTAKASLRGVAVQQGTIEEARTAMQGAHLPYVRMILDELSQMREAAIAARTNLSIGARDFRLFGLCNPDSFNDLAGRFSVPLKGWASVDDNTPTWETCYGKVRHHNGFNSPAIIEPDGEIKYPYLIKQSDIDDKIKESHGNRDALIMWTMVRGWPAPSGISSAVMTENMLNTFHAQEPVVWGSGFDVVAGLDPAFTSDGGGDDCILVIGRVGHDVDGRLVICLGEEIPLKLEASNPRPMTYQILDQMLVLQAQYGFSWDHLGVDDSGTQSVADILEASTGAKVHRVNYSWKASELPISIANRNAANTVYKDRITEYYYAFSEYVQKNQIRGLSADAAHEFCTRKLVEAKRPKRLESKKELKKRIKRSPDHADAVAVLIGVVRERMGILPGATILVPEGPVTPQASMWTPEFIKQFDIDGNAQNYLIPLT